MNKLKILLIKITITLFLFAPLAYSHGIKATWEDAKDFLFD